MKNKPATSLPWEFYCEVGHSNSWICRTDSDNDGDGVVARMECHGTKRTSERKNAATYPVLTERSAQDAAYIVHAANAYPELVEALREARTTIWHMSKDDGPLAKQVERIDALFRKLKETA